MDRRASHKQINYIRNAYHQAGVNNDDQLLHIARTLGYAKHITDWTNITGTQAHQWINNIIKAQQRIQQTKQNHKWGTHEE